MNRIFIFLLCFYFGSAKIRIKELDVPPSVESGSVNDVILDCDFEVVNDTEIEVKWYFRDHTNVIYQWIPGQRNPPQAIGPFKENIDTKYKISSNQNTMYRALHIINISPELSGNYSCKVSGVLYEAVQTKPMVIYDPADTDLELAISEEDNSINCTVGGVFPKPDIKLYILIDKPENETDEILFDDDDDFHDLDEDGTYNVTSILYFDPRNITGPFTYICELTIPGTNYSLRAENTYELEENENVEEEQIEAYLNSINLTESEESAFNETQEMATEYEIQIEEGLQSNRTISDEDDDSSNESSDKKNNNHSDDSDDDDDDDDDNNDDDDDEKEGNSANRFSNLLLLTALGSLAIIFKTS